MELMAYRCKACGKRTHPKRLVCDACGGREWKPEPLTGEVTLLTYTRVHNLPEGIDRAYLDFGIVEFANGVRVTGQLDLKGEAKAGMKLRADVDVVRVVEGEEKVGFVFREE